MNPVSLPYTAILFDLDATMIDSRPVYDEAFTRTFREVLNVEMTQEDRLAYMGMPTRDFLVQFGRGVRIDELAARLKIYVEELMKEAQMFPGISPVLTRLKQAGLKIAVVTAQNRPECLATRQTMQVDDRVDTWVNFEDYSRPKPDPEPVLVALSRLGVAPEQALMVGDSIYDVRAAHAAGVEIAAACWDASQPDELAALSPKFMLQTPEDLLSILGV